MKKHKKLSKKRQKELYNKGKYIINATYTRMNRRMDRECMKRIEREL